MRLSGNLGHFGPLPVLSGCFGRIRFLPNFCGDLFHPVGAGRFSTISYVSCFGTFFWGESYRPDLFNLGNQIRQ